MGIIRRQSIQTSILSYMGYGLGYINVILLFPLCFGPEEFGLTRVLMAMTGVAAQFGLFGMVNGIIRFLPVFKDGDEDGHHGMLGVAFLTGAVGVAVVSLALLGLKPVLVEQFHVKSPLIEEFYLLLFPLLIFEVVFQILTSYTRALYHSVVNVLFREVMVRLLTTVIIGFYYFKLIDFDWFMLLFVGQYALIALSLSAYLINLGRFNLRIDFSFLTPSLRKDLFKYGGFTLLSNIGWLLLLNIDIIMIGAMLGLDKTSFYAVAFYIVALLNVPRNAMDNISIPVIADAWKNDDKETIQKIYTKTAINQTWFGTLIFVGIWANQASIFQLLPAEYSDGKWVLLVVGLARLLDAFFGVNGGIITTSKWFRFDTIANLSLVVVAIIANLLFIPLFGITGAAMATGLTLVLYNLAKYFFLKMKFGFGPFSIKSFAILLLGAASYYCSMLLPELGHWMFDVAIRSLIIVCVYIPIAMYFNLSEDVNGFVRTLRTRYLGR